MAVTAGTEPTRCRGPVGGGRRRSVSSRALSAGAAGALRVCSNPSGALGTPPRRGPGGLVRPRRVRGTCLALHLALPDRAPTLSRRSWLADARPNESDVHTIEPQADRRRLCE